MKSLFTGLFLSIFLFSCSKKNDQAPTGIERINGHYSGGTLSWEKTDNGNKTSGTDANSSFDIAYKDNKATITVNTAAGITNKSYQLNLISSETDQHGYIFQLYEYTDLVQNNSALRVTITTSTTAQLDFNKTNTIDGKIFNEKYSLSGAPQQK